MNRILFLLFLFISLNLNAVDIKRIFVNPALYITGSNSLLDKGNVFFPDQLFTDKYEKYKWLNYLIAYYKSYEKSIHSIEFLCNEDSYKSVFVMQNGDRYASGNCVDISDDMKKLPRIYDYPSGKEILFHSGIYFFNDENYEFFFSVYGKTVEEINKNLKPVKIFGKTHLFNKKNNAAASLRKSLEEIERTAKSSNEIRKWIDGISSINTYSRRTVANENRPSLHSLGIAIDFVIAKSKNVYWLWSSRYKGDWWNIPIDERDEAPQKVVEIFEKYGFVYGGKWFRFDCMHFEYRPEIICYNSAF